MNTHPCAELKKLSCELTTAYDHLFTAQMAVAGVQCKVTKHLTVCPLLHPPTPRRRRTSNQRDELLAITGAIVRSGRSRRALYLLIRAASGRVFSMEDRCPIFLGLLEDAFRATTEALDAESRLKRSGVLPVEVDEDLRLKLEAAFIAQKTLKHHVITCPPCAREANEGV